MLILLKPVKEQFLSLVVKVVNETATAQDRATLEDLTKANPELQAELIKLKAELSVDQEDELFGLYLRVLVKVATVEEIEKVRSLRDSHPKRWEEFLQTAFLLKVMADSANVQLPKPSTPEALAETHQQLLAKLKDAKARRPKP